MSILQVHTEIMRADAQHLSMVAGNIRIPAVAPTGQPSDQAIISGIANLNTLYTTAAGRAIHTSGHLVASAADYDEQDANSASMITDGF